jgi:hypothetical protein
MSRGFANGKHDLEVTAKDAKGAKERYFSIWYLAASPRRCCEGADFLNRITRRLSSRGLELRQRGVLSRVVELHEWLGRRICPFPLDGAANGFLAR